MARASPALYARTMANTPESAHTPANRRQPDSPEQRDGQHPAATRPPAPVATPGAVRNGGALLFPVTSMSRSSGRRLPKAEQVALRRRRGAVRITPEDRTRPRRTAVGARVADRMPHARSGGLRALPGGAADARARWGGAIRSMGKGTLTYTSRVKSFSSPWQNCPDMGYAFAA